MRPVGTGLDRRENVHAKEQAADQHQCLRDFIVAFHDHQIRHQQRDHNHWRWWPLKDFSRHLDRRGIHDQDAQVGDDQRYKHEDRRAHTKDFANMISQTLASHDREAYTHLLRDGQQNRNEQQ
jgi:hypothetical protein